MNTASKLTHLEVCAPPGGDVEDLDAGDDGEESGSSSRTPAGS